MPDKGPGAIDSLGAIFNNETMGNDWHEDDAFWQTFAPHIFPRPQWDAAPAEIDGVLSLCRPPERARVLDLPCGPGRHSLELSKRGFRVTGVDRSRDFLGEARRRAADEELAVEWVRSDMREFRRDEAFHLALHLYTSLGYFRDPADDLKVAENLRCSLRPGGALVVELMGKEVLARIFTERDWWQLDDGSYILEQRRTVDGWAMLRSRWIRIQGNEVQEWTVVHRPYSGSELRALLERAGFAEVELFGDLQGAPYDHEAKRLVAVARVAA